MPSLTDIFIIRKEPLSEEGKNFVKRAYEFAEHAHAGQLRKSGEPYFIHPFETARVISGWGLCRHAIAAGLLHDTAEDTPHTLEEIKKEFGEETSRLVDGVTKLGRFKFREKAPTSSDSPAGEEDTKSSVPTKLGVVLHPTKEETKKFKKKEKEREENFRKMILAISDDMRVIFIKLADRLHNMKTLSALPKQKQERIALETYDIYAPLAYRLGMAAVAGDLEDLALPYLFSKDYRWLQEHVPERLEKREKYLRGVRKMVEKELKMNAIEPIELSFRAKRLSSIHKKLKKYDMDLEQIHDLVALRIIVKTVEDCYRVLGIIHNLWKPLPGKIKDYIALPKPNGYQSLHTTVFCVDNKITEFQIRTEKMHREAQLGLAAHWAYEEEKKKNSYKKRKTVFASKKEAAWINELQKWQEKHEEAGEEFVDSMKIDFFRDRIFAVTPKGDVIDLPHDATPVDFAYNIHSDVGDECVRAKVNGKIVPLDYTLQTGDIVEIQRQKGKKPSESWLRFVKTSLAKSHIKKVMRDKERGNLLSAIWNHGKKKK
ncbi:MAG: RelA/SpoT family protein [Patescibacteria group bacterium]